jgi:hypothetical protein
MRYVLSDQVLKLSLLISKFHLKSLEACGYASQRIAKFVSDESEGAV